VWSEVGSGLDFSWSDKNYFTSLLSKIIHIHRLWTDTYLILHDTHLRVEIQVVCAYLHMLYKTGDIQHGYF